MNNIKPIHLVLAKDRLRELKRGYPWVFRHQLADSPTAESGSFALLKSRDGEIIAKGFYDPESILSFRVLTLGKENVTEELIYERVEQAISARESLISSGSTGYRVINGEGDLLPGLIVDRYGEFCVMQFDGAGPRGFYKRNEIAQVIAKRLKLTGVYRKPRHSEGGEGEVLFGQLPPDQLEFQENHHRFSLDIKRGQKTGFFLDQRENRKLIGNLADNQRVLNLFGYTGGFSIYAGINGASEVSTIDMAKPAIANAELNWKINGLAPERHITQAVDAFEFLERSKTERSLWDLVIVDPPSFAHSADSVDAAMASYHKLFVLSLNVVRAGGLIAFSSCSSHITSEMFNELCVQAVSSARRRGCVIANQGQPIDHPYPLACPELRYLKFVVMKINH